jgi:hypothetical protein
MHLLIRQKQSQWRATGINGQEQHAVTMPNVLFSHTHNFNADAAVPELAAVLPALPELLTWAAMDWIPLQCLTA